MLIAFLIGPAVIARLRAMKVRQVVREGTPDSHQTKGNTPTMGGLIILIAGLVPTLLWARLNNRYVWTAIVVTAWMGAIGFLDDYLKLRQQREGKKNEGLVERYKLAGQVAIGIALGAWLWLDPLSVAPRRVDDAAVLQVRARRAAGRPGLYVPWVTFVLTGVSNAVNLTDGLDGLAGGLVGDRLRDLRDLRVRHRPVGHEPLPADLLPARRRASSPCSARRSSGR